MIRDVHPGFLPLPDPGVQKAPNPDPQHWFILLFLRRPAGSLVPAVNAIQWIALTSC
jgi:hypothetical protein